MRHHNFTKLEWLAVCIVLVGGFNYIFIGLYSWDILAMAFGQFEFLVRAVYVLIGASAMYLIYRAIR